MSKLNIALLKKVRNRIKRIPESYNQEKWYGRSIASPCGTVACLAGETIICAAPTVVQGINDLRELANSNHDDVPVQAAKLLGLRGNYFSGVNEGQTKIFRGGGYGFPEPYRTQYQKARTRKDKAAVTVAYLDHVIATGKILK